MGTPNLENLRPFSKDDVEKARAAGRKGGVASGVAKRRKRTFRELIETVMTMEVDDPAVHAKLTELGLDPTHDMAITMAAVKKAENGDIEATRYLRDTKGEKPTEALQMAITDKPIKALDLTQLSDAELEALADGLD
jgi:hypothetical protein